MSVRVKLNMKGLNALMTSRPVTAEVVRRAKKMRDAAGEDFEYNVVPHKWTARAFVRAANAKGAREEARSKVLERSIDAARGV